ncbi:MAG: acyl-CoA thioesterase domain-containing protein [Parerythrobacter sp.]
MSDPAQTPSPQQLVTELVSLLTVEPTGPATYTGRPQPDGIGRVFGGQVVAQALQAAQASASDGKIAHSLHVYFLRGGREGVPIDYTVTTDFEGRSFANRRVLASQEGTPILNCTLSFQLPETGLSHQDAPMPDVPAPDTLPSDRTLRERWIAEQETPPSNAHKAFMLRPRAIEMRPAEPPHWMASPETGDLASPVQHNWLRTAAALPDDPALHRAVLAYASDYTLLGTAAIPHGLSWMRGEVSGASLDHAVWFHDSVRCDDWLLYSTKSPWSGAGRGFNRGQIFTANGTLVASVAQEGVLRRKRSGS